MKLRKLELNHFRNIHHVLLEPHPRLNFLIGKNGQGKSSVLEAIGFLSHLRSFRAPRHGDAIQSGLEAAILKGSLSGTDRHQQIWNHELQIELRIDKKLARINEKLVRSSTEYILSRHRSFGSGFHAVIFNPSDHELIRGEPKRRRSFLDQIITATHPDVFQNWQGFYKVLEQRNRLLKMMKLEAAKGYEVEFESFTEQLIKYGARLTFDRLRGIRHINRYLPDIASKIAPNQKPIAIKLCSSWMEEKGLDIRPAEGHWTGHPAVVSIEEIEEKLSAKLKGSRVQERLAQTTTIGPQRDDWGVVLGEGDLKTQGSQGEVRTALLGLKFSELCLFEEETGAKPVLLLDDLSSELDEERREFLLKFLQETDLQVFVTTTESMPISQQGKRFILSEGTVCQQS